MEHFKFIWNIIYNFFFEVCVFKNLTFNLTGPICKCKTKNIQIYIGPDISLECRTCKIKLTIPIASLTSFINLDTPYPDNTAPNNKNIDNVIPFKKD